MKYTVYDRLLKREVGHERRRYTDIRGIYGDRQWVRNLDIVNELEGHNGCVNALSWSRSGRLLASGSDDHRINIHSYHPDSSTSQFSLSTSILTGHRSNIFSVKFMPYSNDRTIVSATDDVRIFDIEHSGHSAFGSGGRSQTQAQRRLGGIYRQREDVTLTAADTNEQAFRSHGDTVKQIVTEDNPFYFLTCSNDGDVRQWDIRQPSKAYPSASADNVPPPLISYSRYGLDLNTVSCSPSQPHYIALGGAHLHCFLHDRRMLGRDVNSERGSRLSSPANWTDNDDELLGQATQCVKKFAPGGKQRMRRNDGGHITACKISDACPNELIVSWSQDHIYSFDIQRTPDAREEVKTSQVSSGDMSGRVKDKSRKRKRPKSSIMSQEAADRVGSRQRTESSDDDLALRVTYGNGQSEEIRIEAPAENRMSQEELAEIRESEHFRIARTAVKIKKRLFDLSELGEAGLQLSFTSILGFAHSILSDMDDMARLWGYPVDPDPVDVAVQNTLRDSRAASRRFVQAAGTLSRVMGGQLLIGSRSDDLIAQYFASIQPAPRERGLPQHEQFGYDFLKAILLWLDSGPSAVVEGFSSRSSSSRLPIPQDSDMYSIDEVLIPYLLELASDDPIINVDASRFETDDLRILYSSEQAAVLAFSDAVNIPFADLTGAQDPASSDGPTQDETQERQTAKWHWGLKVARGVLFNAAKDIKFAMVDRAFGGLGISDATIRAEEQALREQQADIDPLDDGNDDEEFDEADFVARALLAEANNEQTEGYEDAEMDDNDDEDDEDEDEDEDSDGDVEDSDLEESDDTESADEEGLQRTRSGQMLWRSEYGRRRYQREKVGLDVACAPHTRVYRGHCNVRTVKGVNYFGLQDEYVVSGSDSGHVFVWDRKTAELVNILEGDGEVVNVVQGHPYEPTMAVSGIDHTIKIFSPDVRDQRNARRGIGVHAVDASGFPSLGWQRRRQERSTVRGEVEGAEDSSDSDSDGGGGGGGGEAQGPGLSSRKRMHQAYQIMSKNDMDTRGGRDDYFISQAVFAQLARHIASSQGQEDGDGEGVGPIVLDEDNCNVM